MSPQAMTAPNHAFEVAIRAGGATWEETMDLIREWVLELEERGQDCNMVRAGPSFSGYVQVHTNPTMTRERHAAELRAFLDGKKGSK